MGLLGGSLGLALRKRRLAKRVVGYVRRDATVTECRRLRVAHEVTRDLAAAVADADLIILCTPLAQMRALVTQAAPHLKRGAIVTDVGSVKVSVVKELESLVTKAGGQFVGSHPMAGGERTGVRAARVDLFSGAACAITPTAKSSPAALRKVEQLWRDLGCRTLQMTPKLHDELVARSSHLPHVLAAQITRQVLDPKHPAAQALLCAGGFRDTTRIASGSPEMWRDIVLANRRPLARELKRTLKEADRFLRALEDGDAGTIEAFFTEAKTLRDGWSA